MPSKRSKRNVQRFNCPHCERRLWRLGSPKHFLYYLQPAEIQQNVNISRKNAVFLANKGVYVDSNSWIEEFLCGDDGKLWLKVNRKSGGTLVTTLASSKDWLQTTRTILPDTPNPSVGEFTYRMSRQAGIKLSYSRE